MKPTDEKRMLEEKEARRIELKNQAKAERQRHDIQLIEEKFAGRKKEIILEDYLCANPECGTDEYLEIFEEEIIKGRGRSRRTVRYVVGYECPKCKREFETLLNSLNREKTLARLARVEKRCEQEIAKLRKRNLKY